MRVLATSIVAVAGAACTAEVGAPLPNPSGSAHDWTGAAVAIDSNWALAGVPRSDSITPNAGKVLVYRLSGGSWSLVQTLVPGTPESYGLFGSSLDLSGARAIVGTHEEWQSRTFGAAYIYERSGASWTQTARLNGDTLASYFASSVAISGDYAVVGAPGPSPMSIVGPGVAHVYRRDSGGAWLHDTTLRASDAVSYMEFGFSVAIEADVMVVGARGGQYVADAAYVFRRSGASWIEEAKLTPLDSPIHRYFGSSVSVSRGIVMVGAPYDDAKGQRAGAAYIFERDSLGTWLQIQKLLPSSLTADDRYGSSVSIDFPHAISGAPLGDGTAEGTGTSFAYVRGEYGWLQAFELMATDGGYGDAFGSSVSVSGTCAMVGAPEREFDGVWIGASYIYCLPVKDPQAPEIDIICCWQPPSAPVVVATIRYRNPGNSRVVARRRIELVAPSGQASDGVTARSLILSPGDSTAEQVIIPVRSTLERGRYELRLRWSDDAGELIERAYFVPPARNEAALGARRGR